MQVVNDTAECAVQYTHKNRGHRDLDDVILVATDYCGCVAQLRKDNLNAI